MKYDIHTLSNGLRIILAPMPTSKTTTVMIMTATGSRYEDERENGLAHFLEHMFFKGTKKRKNAKVISEELDSVGSTSNAFTSKDRTAYYAKVSSEYTDTALDVISDMFLNSTLPQKEITKERGAIIQEIDMYEDMPMRDVGDVFETLLFGADHALGRTILGPKENIRAFSKKDFEAYRRKNYAPHNTVVTIAGSFDAKKVIAKIKKEFGTRAPAASKSPDLFSISQTTPRVAIKEKKTDQTQFILGVPGYPYLHQDEYALHVLTAVLGSGMSSRLFMEIREKHGLAYSVHAWVDQYPDTGYFGIQAGVEHDKLEKAVATALTELKKISRTPVSAAELKKAKAYLRGTITMSLETSNRIAESLSTSLLSLGRIRDLEEFLKGIEAVTAQDITRVARDIFKSHLLNLAVIGPHSNSSALQKLLKV